MTAIIDYGVGNLFSLRSSLERLGAEVEVTSDPAVLEKADRVILPGVGAFADAAEKLRKSGLDQVVKELAQRGKPLLGICLGMQLLFDKSLEYGEHSGLGLIHGTVVPFAGKIPQELPIPHIGWNSLQIKKEASPLFRYIQDGAFVYFVHSYFAADCAEAVSAATEYGIEVTASVEEGNVFGCQFHPEKSGKAGLEILRAFLEMEGVS